MPKVTARTYSRYSLEAITLLGKLIRAARKERKMTAQEVANRAGISRGLLQRIEKGDPKCALGATFEVATIVGVKLFDAQATTLSKHIRQTEDKLALLPKSVRKKVKVADDDQFLVSSLIPCAAIPMTMRETMRHSGMAKR